MLKLSKLARSTFYYYLKARKDKYLVEKQEIQDIFANSKNTYGYRRITLELRQKGYVINHKTVLKLMKTLKIYGKQRKSKYKSYRGEVGKVAPNLLDREFNSNAPYTKLATDVTEFSVCNEKVYLSPVLDMFNNEILSYSISTSPNFLQTKEMLKGLFERLPKTAIPILHSDQGWQYQHKQYQKMLIDHGIVQSMSRKGNCLDNAVIENFFGLLKSELLYLQEFSSMEHFKQELLEYLDYYNNRRIKLKLKGLTPALHRLQALSVA